MTESRHLPALTQLLPPPWDNIPIYTAPRDVLARLTGYELTRGMLCAMRRPPLPSPEEICRSARRLVILENITDSTNIGAIFRSAAALGMDGILVSSSCCDPLYRRSVRVSMGTVFQIPWAPAGMGMPFSGHSPESPPCALWAFPPQPALTDNSISLEDPVLADAESWPLCWARRETACVRKPLPTVITPPGFLCTTAWILSMWPLPERSSSGSCVPERKTKRTTKMPAASAAGIFCAYLFFWASR